MGNAEYMGLSTLVSVCITMSSTTLFLYISLLLTCVSFTLGDTIQTPDTRIVPEDMMDDRISMAGIGMDIAACAATCAWDSNASCSQGPIGLPKPCWMMKPMFKYLLKLTTGIRK